MYTQSYFDDLFRLSTVFDNLLENKSFHRTNYPLLNIREDENEIEIMAQVPGINSSDIEIEIVEKKLTLSGEKRHDEQNTSFLRRERTFGKFSKSVNLPYRVDTDNINAEIKNGILTVKLSKAEDAKPKKIEVR